MQIVADLSDLARLETVVCDVCPDVVVHCAGIAHQKVGSIDRDDYFKFNTDLTINLFEKAVKNNPATHFIFLSSVTVYGELSGSGPVSEDEVMQPSGHYAESKMEAEKRLIARASEYPQSRLDILRLAPVYDADWAFNLERRVFAPGKFCYLKFGDGKQSISALSRQNAVAFVRYLIASSNEGVSVYNVCDKRPYSFDEIGDVFRRAEKYGAKLAIPVPRFPVYLFTRLAGFVQNKNRSWWHACYKKLFFDLIFDNSQMLDAGFEPKHTLESVLLRK